MADTSLMVKVDVRTNMLALLVINTLVLTGKGGVFQVSCMLLVCGLLLLIGRWQAAIALGLSMGALMLLPVIAEDFITSQAVVLLLAATMYMRPYLIAGFMGFYFICATPPNLLIAGMQRLRMPQAVTIPLAVMLRFFPVIREELQAIRGAMRMRGLPGSGGALLHPWRALEYILIPLIGATLRAGESLSSSALTRGLGSPVKPTTILSLTFGVADLLLVMLCIGLGVLFFCSGSMV